MNEDRTVIIEPKDKSKITQKCERKGKGKRRRNKNC